MDKFETAVIVIVAVVAAIALGGAATWQMNGSAAPTPTPNATPTPSQNATPTPYLTPVDGECPEGYVEVNGHEGFDVSGTGFERCDPAMNATPTGIVTDTPTPTPAVTDTPTPTATPTPTPADDTVTFPTATETPTPTPTQTATPTPTPVPDDGSDQASDLPRCDVGSHGQYDMKMADEHVNALFAQDGVRAVGQGVGDYSAEDWVVYINAEPGTDVEMPCTTEDTPFYKHIDNGDSGYEPGWYWFNLPAENTDRIGDPNGETIEGKMWLADRDPDNGKEYPDWFINWLLDFDGEGYSEDRVDYYGEDHTCERDGDGFVCETTPYLAVGQDDRDELTEPPSTVNGEPLEHRPID